MRYFDYSPMYYHTSFWPGSILALLLNILIWAVVIYLFVTLVKRMSHGGHGHCCGGHEEHEQDDDSYYLHIVKERFAKGEIDRKQFEEIKKGLLEKDESPIEEK